MEINLVSNKLGKKELCKEIPQGERIVNPAGYVGMSKSIANLLYNGNVSYFDQVSKLFDVTDEVKTSFDDLTVNEIQKLSSVEKLQKIQEINSKINDAIYSGKLQRKKQIEEQIKKDQEDLKAYRAMQQNKEPNPTPEET